MSVRVIWNLAVLSWAHEYHNWLEALHITVVIMWMAGMLYLPRLYVYHAEVKDGSESGTVLTTMERRLLLYIMNPAMLTSLASGTLLALAGKHYTFLWFHIKATLVVMLLAIHALLAKHGADFSRNKCACSSLYFRILNETVTALIAAIVILVTVKPFRD
ncbi:MAG: CopD family protein [Anaplasma sp.]